jgi:nucleoside-diphosphate-sugar epimerase
MKIAITGGTGFLGRYIIEALSSQENAITAWFRPKSTRSLESVDLSHQQNPTIQWIPGELGDSSATQSLVANADILIHAALSRTGISFRGSEGNLEEYMQRNFIGSIKLLEAARAAGVRRVVLVSTCAVHEKILSDRPLDETHPVWPASHYGAGKAALEAMVHSYALGQNWEIAAIRPCGIYGVSRPIQESKWYNLVLQVANGESVHVQGGGKEVHAADVAKAIALMCTAPAEKIIGGIYNCCDRYVSQFEVATLAKEISGSQAKIIGSPSQPKNQIDSSRLLSLGFEFGGVEKLRETITQILRSRS